ncbi:MAG TPA: cytidine deaminase [Defluviitaleaceae bacterium]|jgi:cytidine deaminase|nr:cytidine deaminase [Defluviitaleaceae bacterium]HPT75532.1 cytidine deaminase [Defluviitaleaceae bacterium]HQD51037.1 cytidine deaminase [Defluviitaleaceae bacterium]
MIKRRDRMNYEELIKRANEAKENAYAPYSNFKVGAAVLTGTGKIYTGCNIENVSFGATNCAERTAIFKAVSDGEKAIKAVAVMSSSGEFTYPCGICRQVIAEFSEDAKIILGNSRGDIKVYSLDEILPCGFTKENSKNFE